MTETDINRPTVLLTGPTSGIGATMLDRLIAHPSRPRLVLVARDPLALDTAVGRARSAGLEARGFRLDLGDLESVAHAINEITEVTAVDTIDVAILNAGAQFATGRKTGAQGYELTFTVNVIAQHLLLLGLEPLLARGAHTVLLGSSTHRGKKESFNLVPDPEWREPAQLATADSPATPDRFDRERGGVAYASSKLALVTLAHDWAQRHSLSGRRLNTYDPGLVPGTGLGKDLPPYMYWVWKNVMPVMRLLPGASSPTNSGRRAVELAMGDAFPTLHDGYVEIDRVTQAEPVTFSSDRREALWAWLDATVQPFLPKGVR